MIKQNAIDFLESVQSLFIYGASGLVALGIYLNQEMGVAVSFYPWLWFSGSLFIYNLDRLIPDPADFINTPERTRYASNRKFLILLSLAVLIFLPIYEKQWLVFVLVLAAIALSSLYSLTPPGLSWRIKDFLFLKWIIPPFVILVTLTIPTWISQKNWVVFAKQWPLLGEIFAALLINILLFDQRDRLGDATTGLKTIVNQLTPTRFFYFLLLILLLQITFLAFAPQFEMVVFAIYMAILIIISQKKRSPNFYHWAVDGMLFVPLGCIWLKMGF